MNDAEQPIYFFHRSVKLLITRTIHSVGDKTCLSWVSRTSRRIWIPCSIPWFHASKCFLWLILKSQFTLKITRAIRQLKQNIVDVCTMITADLCLKKRKKKKPKCAVLIKEELKNICKWMLSILNRCFNCNEYRTRLYQIRVRAFCTILCFW